MRKPKPSRARAPWAARAAYSSRRRRGRSRISLAIPAMVSAGPEPRQPFRSGGRKLTADRSPVKRWLDSVPDAEAGAGVAARCLVERGVPTRRCRPRRRCSQNAPPEHRIITTVQRARSTAPGAVASSPMVVMGAQAWAHGSAVADCSSGGLCGGRGSRKWRNEGQLLPGSQKSSWSREEKPISR